VNKAADEYFSKVFPSASSDQLLSHTGPCNFGGTNPKAGPAMSSRVFSLLAQHPAALHPAQNTGYVLGLSQGKKETSLSPAGPN